MDGLNEKARLNVPSFAVGAAPAAFVSALHRAALPIVLCAGISAGAAYFYARTLPKSYTAEGMVAVEADHMAIPELQGALRTDNSPDPLPLVHTEVQALSAKDLVSEVAFKLHLDADPEFNSALQVPGLVARGKTWLRTRLLGEVTTKSDGSYATHDSVLGAVEHNLVLSQDNRSLAIGISFNAQDPSRAALFVNTLITDYIDSRAQRRVSANVGASAVVSQRIEQVRTDIERIEKQMRDLRQSSGLVGTRAGSVGQQQVEDLATAASRATLDRSSIEANWERASGLASGGSSDALASVLDSATISHLREQEAQAGSKVADLQQRYGSNYPALRSAQADLVETRREISSETHRIVASLATQLRVARAHEADVLTQLAHARNAGVSAQNTQAQLDQLQQDAATRRDLYRTLLERAQQTATTPQSSETPDVRILSRATPPGLPSAPNVKMAVLFGGFGGGLLACMSVLLLTRSNGGPRNAATFAEANGIRVVGTIRGRQVRSLADRLVRTSIGPEIDVLRTTRTRIGQLSRTPLRVVGFVGGQRSTAATLVACAYARCLANDGQHVLLIDQDPGSGLMERVLGETHGRFEEALSGDICWRDAVNADRVAGLDTLVGSIKTDAHGGGRLIGLENLLAEARGEYDLIVIGAAAASDENATRTVRAADITVVVYDEAQMKLSAAAVDAGRMRNLARNQLAAFVLTRG